MRILNTTLLALALCTPLLASAKADQNYYGTLSINKGKTKSVKPVEYGIHYEEIGMIGEGTLHAEMIRNRTFEEATPPKGLAVENGKYKDVPGPDGQNKHVFHVDPLIGWAAMPLAYSPVKIARTEQTPLNEHNTYSMSVDITSDIKDFSNAMIVNKGYYGMNLDMGVDYNFSMFLKSNNYNAPIKVALLDLDGNIASNIVTLDLSKRDWHKVQGSLHPTKDVQRGMFAIIPTESGRFQVDVVTMFPSNTYDDGKSIFRADIIKNIQDLEPSFIRFPGGCIVHGTNEETMYHWKETIGATENRAGAWSKWAPYYRTDGLGYHEFYELCEYVGADAMYVTATGMVCTGWVYETGKWQHSHPEVDLDAYIQDALDAIEYAIGDTSTKYGAMRAENGHPEPFPLKYLEIGNEDYGPTYWDRYEKMYNALHAKYPQLHYIANSIIGKSNHDKRGHIEKFVNPKNVKIFDEHYYQPIEWAANEHYKFDKYERGVADIFIGELGVDGEYPANLLANGTVRIALERNSDMNSMIAERPFMRMWEDNGQRPMLPMIINSVDQSVKSAYFYMVEMFNDNTYTKNIDAHITNFEGQQSLFTSMGYDEQSREYVLKFINIAPTELTVKSAVKGFWGSKKAELTQLTLRKGEYNTPNTPNVVKPTTSKVSINLSKDITIPAHSMMVYRFK